MTHVSSPDGDEIGPLGVTKQSQQLPAMGYGVLFYLLASFTREACRGGDVIFTASAAVL